MNLTDLIKILIVSFENEVEVFLFFTIFVVSKAVRVGLSLTL